jgi:hypothetical protein
MSEFTKEDYDAIVERIKAAGTSVDEGYKAASNAASTLCDVNQTMEYNPNITVVRNGGGEVIGYDYKYTAPTTPNDTAISVDSNNDHGSFGTATGGGGYSVGGGAGMHRSSFYAGSINTDQSSTDKATGVDGVVAGYVSPEWGLVSALSKFGKSVTDTASDVIVGTAETMSNMLETIATRGGEALRVLFGVDDHGNTTMYMDSDTLGMLAIASRDNGLMSVGGDEGEELSDSINLSGTQDFSTLGRNYTYVGPFYYIETTVFNYIHTATGASARRYVLTFNKPAYIVIFSSRNEKQITYIAKDGGDDTYFDYVSYRLSDGSVYNNGRRYLNQRANHLFYGFQPYYYSETLNSDNWGGAPAISTWYGTGYGAGYVANESLYVINNGQFVETGILPDGVTEQPGSTNPVDAVTGADPHVVGENLATQYPDLMGTPIQIVVMDDSCNEKTINYYSVPISYSPTDVGINVPVTGTLQVSPSFNPDIELPDVDIDKYVKQIIEQLSGSGAGRGLTTIDPSTGDAETATDEPPTTGSGTTPPAVMPEAQVTAMWHVYHPTSSALSALGSWLWSSSIIDQIVRLFTNPMEAIIGVHAIYAVPTISSPVPIVVGNLTSNVDAAPVTRQYVSLDCGTVEVFEYFGNVFDYDPFTKISLYLPFIGIVPLRVADVMRGFVHIVYNIDVYTGACIAMVDVSRDGVGGVLYQFTGNCAVEYPVSGANYSRMLQAAMSAGVASLASGMATGGNPFMGAIAAGTAFTQGKMDFQRSGSFSGNPGAMGPKKPYLIITRPQTNMADQYQLYDGRGSNFTTKLKQCSGYTRCKEVHLNVPGAYHDELLEIERLLKEGVLFPGGAEM